MGQVTVSVEIDRSPSEVWADVRNIASHVDWMADATEIRFTSETIEGAETTFECDTRIGPIGLTDVMTITSWVDEVEMGVRHVGVVTGDGRFTLDPIDGSRRTRFTWNEVLRFPFWLGGPIGGLVAKPILTAVWKRNLGRLQRRLSPEHRSPHPHR